MYYESVRLKHGPLPSRTDHFQNGRALDLQVLFTDLDRTADALATARRLARDLGAHITLMVAQVVPYPLPLTAPDVPVEFTEHLLEPLAAEDIDIAIYLCRDRDETIRRALAPDSLVVVGTRTWWRSFWDRSLIRVLRRDGLRVVAV